MRTIRTSPFRGSSLPWRSGASLIALAAIVAAGCTDDPVSPDPSPSSNSLTTTQVTGTSSVTGPTASFAGTTGDIIDSDASSPTFLLRHVGDPAPSGYSHVNQWASPAILTASPEDGPVAFEGTLDIDDQVEGQVSMIGLIDSDALAAGEHGSQTGVYIYVFRSGTDAWRIGVTDGNVEGEIVQTFITVSGSDLPTDGVLNVTFTIDGTADGTTCAVTPPASPAPAGCMTLEITGGSVNSTLTDSYGDVTASSSASPEFANGGVPGWDDFNDAEVVYDLTLGPVVPLDGEAPAVTDVEATPNPASVSEDFDLTANVDDTGLGDSNIASAEFSLDGGPWTAMDAADGALDEVSEAVEALDVMHGLEPGLYPLCVRGTDAAGNTSADECVTLVVYDPAGGFVTGGGWIDSEAGAFMPSPTTVVTEEDIDQQTDASFDWLRFEQGAGDGTFASGPAMPPLGSGSFHLSSNGSSDKVTLFNYDHVGTRLANIEGIAYATYRSSTSTNSVAQYPAINIQVDYDGDGSFTTLVWEPIYPFGQGALMTDAWQTWDAMATSQTGFGGGWWSTSPIPGVCAFNCFVSWETIVSNNPDAEILGGFGVNIGSGWNGEFSGATDALSITASGVTTTYDLEAASAFDPTGKATFGFVSKYKKGADRPDGNTEFQFRAADLNFHSTSYDWLVVTGSDYARFKGEGTINGAGGYKFMLWAGDDDAGDTFRIKIWEEVGGTESVVYDNGMDQVIGGGSIIVHDSKGKGKK